ncbi:hypothetical protein D3C72_2185610 [compost metagenome]
MADDAAVGVEGTAQASLIGKDHTFDIVAHDVVNAVLVSLVASHFSHSLGIGGSTKRMLAPLARGD